MLDIEEVKESLVEWRKSKKKGREIPPKIRKAILKLTEEYTP
jgi:hypothetical protein